MKLPPADRRAPCPHCGKAGRRKTKSIYGPSVWLGGETQTWELTCRWCGHCWSIAFTWWQIRPVNRFSAWVRRGGHRPKVYRKDTWT